MFVYIDYTIKHTHFRRRKLIMKKNSDSNKFLLPLVFIVALAFIWKRGFFSTDKPKKAKQINTIVDEAEPTPWETEAPTAEAPPKGVVDSIEEKDEEVKVTEVKEPINHFKESIKRQEVIKNTFLNNVKADIELPEDMDYLNIDADEGIGVIYGKSKVGDREFAMLATRKRVNMNLETKYLRENSDMLHLLRNLKISTKLSTKNIKAPRGSGLKSVSYTKLGQTGGKTVYSVLTSRSDNRGSYMFLMKADESFYKDNDGYLNKLLSSLKAKK
jgi:hypothetical protein